MFASCSLAARIDRAEARLTESVVSAVTARAPAGDSFVEAFAGGVAAYAGLASPMNKAIGVGFEGVPPLSRLREIEARFRERDAPLQFEVSTLADPALVTLLTREGYLLTNFENVSGRRLVAGDREPRNAPSVRIEPLAEPDTTAWIDAAITAFQHGDERGVAPEALPPREALEAALRPFATAPGFLRYGAWVDGELAATASLRIDDGIDQLCGAATLPAFRRRGIHGALFSRRLADSIAAGCEVAVVTTQPGSTSQQNASQKGFALLYTRAVLVNALTPANATGLRAADR